jgi:hypothetical protein
VRAFAQISSFATMAATERREADGNESAHVRTLSIFSKESARRGVQPSMASPATAESQAGQPAATCSPRAQFAKLPPPGPGTGRHERDRLAFLAGFSAPAAGCSGLPVDFWTAAAAGAGSGGGGGRSGLDAEGRPCTQPIGVGHRWRRRMERGGVKWSSASEEEGTEGAALWCAVEGLTPMLMRSPFPACLGLRIMSSCGCAQVGTGGHWSLWGREREGEYVWMFVYSLA